MAKRLKSEVGESNGCDYFENLPEEVVILIFTKLSSASGNNTLEEDVKSLVQCSSVSKRFNALNSLVPTLFISHPSIKLLDKYCPQILNKFKHIRSLHVKHTSTTETELYDDEPKIKPCILWEAVYEPGSYCLAVASCTHMEKYSNLQHQSSGMHFNVADHVKKKLRVSNRIDTSDMFFFHQTLFSSLREHKMLETVVVANIRSPELGNFILEEDMLDNLRNYTGRKAVIWMRAGCADILDIPLTQSSGFVMSNIYYNVFEWLENDKDLINKLDDNFNYKFDDEHNTLKKVLKGLLENQILQNPVG